MIFHTSPEFFFWKNFFLYVRNGCELPDCGIYYSGTAIYNFTEVFPEDLCTTV